MTLAQTYAHQCGVLLPQDAPDFPSNFVSLPERYITFSPKIGQPGKDYPYFDIVISMLNPFLSKEKISVIQLGLKNEPQIPGTHKPDMTLRQTAHAIKNALAHITVDTMSAHLAGGYKTPLVEIFGSTNENSARPHYLGKHIFLKGYKDLPTYTAEDPTLAIRNVLPETVAQATLDILGIKETIGIKTSFIGDNYSNRTVDFFPNFRPDYQKLQGNLNLRMDQIHNEEILRELIHNRQQPFGLTLSKPLKENFPKHKFARVWYFINEDYRREDVLSMKDFGIPVIFLYRGPKEKIGEVRLDLNSPYDMEFIHVESKSEVEIPPGSVFNTHRIFLSSGNVFGSVFHAKSGIPGTNGVPIGKGEDLREFRESINNYHIYSKA